LEEVVDGHQQEVTAAEQALLEMPFPPSIEKDRWAEAREIGSDTKAARREY
jgi:hypothetical protein